MTLLSPHRGPFMDYTNANQDLPLNQCGNLEEVFTEIASELSQIEWVGVARSLRINPDKLHLVTLSSGCDLQRQKTLGLLCWVEDERSSATFERLVAALSQVEAKTLSGDIKAFARLLRMRKAAAQRKLEAIHTQYYPLPLSTIKHSPKSAHGQWKFAELPHFLMGPAAAFFPSRSVPSNSTFDLTSSVSIHGAKLNLLQREIGSEKTKKKTVRPSTIAGKATQQRKRALGIHKRIGQLGIRTSIKTAVPLTNTSRDCHPEMVQELISNKLFNYLLNGNGSREVLSMVSTLESINGLVVRKLSKGSIKIETYLHKTSALKALWGHFESGQLNDMLQEHLISDNSLKMAGAFAISLETSIDRTEMDGCLQQLQGSNRKSTAPNSSSRRALGNYIGNSPPRTRMSFSKVPRAPFSGLQSSSQLRVTSVPHSRSINVELSPSIRTVKPGPRVSDWRSEKARFPVRSDKVAGVVFADEEQLPVTENTKDEVQRSTNDVERQSAPPPSPDLEDPGESPDTNKRSEEEEEEIRLALEDLHKRTHEAENSYKQFNEVVLRRFVDSLKNASDMGIEKIGHVGDLRKYATILRKNDAADVAQLVEEFVNVTESLDRIHRDVTSKIWLRVADVSTASAKSRDSTGSHRRSPMRNQVSQSIEIWRQMLDPQFDFTELKTGISDDLKKIFTPEELEEYGGLLSHIPALLSAAKSCHQLLSHYNNAP